MKPGHTREERFERWTIMLEGCTSKELKWLRAEAKKELQRREEVMRNALTQSD